MRSNAFKSLVISLALSAPALAGVVETTAGKQWIGRATLEDGSIVAVTTADGQTAKIPLADVVHAEFGAAAPRFEKITIADANPAWQSSDVGAVHAPGRCVAAGNGLDITASGWGIWSMVDSFNFVHQSIDGDGQIVAHVTMPANSPTAMTAGVMIRESLDPTAPFAAMVLESTGEVHFKTRPYPKELPPAVPAQKTPAAWVRLARAGQVVTAMQSKDGQFWQPLASAHVKLDAKVEFGLVTTTEMNATTGTAHFDAAAVSRGNPAECSLVPSPLPAGGVILADGTGVAGKVTAFDQESVTLTGGDAKPQTFALKDVAWVVCRPSAIDATSLLAQNNAGMMLQTGDFFEGDLTRFSDGKFDVNSILFGPKTFDATTDALVAVLRSPTRWARFHVIASSGKIYAADQLSSTAGVLMADHDKIPVDDITDIVATSSPANSK